jgi:TATA-box binding protein (TBP) (component of TFIID and TFIIIB)
MSLDNYINKLKNEILLNKIILNKNNNIDSIGTDINWNEYNFIDYLDIKENEIRDLPKGVSISTMCGKCHLNTKVDIDNIYNYLKLNKNDILTVKVNDNKIRTLLPTKIKKRRTNKKKSNKSNPFYNQITIVVRIDEEEHLENEKTVKKINVKLFKNGSIQMSGLKNVKDTNRALNKLVYKLSEINNDIHFIEDHDNITIKNFNIYMINSNYKLSTHIKRYDMYDIFKKLKIDTNYEKSVRACVIVKFCPTIENNEEKAVSIFIFEKGNIIITGARNLHHIKESYDYINTLIYEYIDLIQKIDDEENIELILRLFDEVMKENSHKFNINNL